MGDGGIILAGGRVIDPESALDGLADVWILGDKIAGIGAGLRPDGARVIPVEGCIVGPGFVDLHSHVHSVAGQRLQALDGVCTALDLESGLMPLDKAYADAAEQRRPLHYGFAASWSGARSQVLAGITPDATFAGTLAVLGNADWQRSSTPAELAAWLDLIDGEIASGALGVGVLMGYAPHSDPAEFAAVARRAAAFDVPVFSHVRELVEADPATPVDGSGEIAQVAAETGARLHHCHVNSTSRRHIDRVLATLDAARAAGSRVTVEAYPYGAGSTGIGAAFLDPDRLSVWGIGPSAITVLTTGERIADEGRLAQLRTADPGAPCIVEFLDEGSPRDLALLESALAFPDAIVASDAMPVVWPGGVLDCAAWPLPPGGATHPRTAGTFAKTLRRMVRETGRWTWSEAFRRCSYLPARVLDEVAPAMRGKGRLAVGADADVVVLDPARITDAATYADPTRPSVGVGELLVAGEFVVRGGDLVTAAMPGRAIRAPHR